MVGIPDLVGGDQPRAQRHKRVERLAAAPLAAAPLQLPVAGADVVGAGVPEHVIEGVLAADVLAGFADHHRQLAFVVHLLAPEMGRQQDRVARVLQGGG